MSSVENLQQTVCLKNGTFCTSYLLTHDAGVWKDGTGRKKEKQERNKRKTTG